MCYEFERWNWKSRAQRSDEKVMPKQSTPQRREEAAPAKVREPAREEKVTEKVPA